MEFNYDSIMKFMQDYFKAFDRYSRSPDTIKGMDDYFAPDLEFVPYMAGNRYLKGRDKFVRLLYSHPSSIEKLEPATIVVDDRQKIAAVIINSRLLDAATQKVLVKKSYFVNYYLSLDDKQTIKIKKIQYFEEILPKGALDLGDVFARDPAMARILTED